MEVSDFAANFTASRRLVFGRLSWGIEGGPCPAREARQWLSMTAVKCGLPITLRRWSVSSATPIGPRPCATKAGLPRGVILMDAGYGSDTQLRTDVTALGFPYVGGILSNTSVRAQGAAP